MFSKYLDSLDAILKFLFHNSINLIVCGDFNVNFSDNTCGNSQLPTREHGALSTSCTSFSAARSSTVAVHLSLGLPRKAQEDRTQNGPRFYWEIRPPLGGSNLQRAANHNAGSSTLTRINTGPETPKLHGCWFIRSSVLAAEE